MTYQTQQSEFIQGHPASKSHGPLTPGSILFPIHL